MEYNFPFRRSNIVITKFVIKRIINYKLLYIKLIYNHITCCKYVTSSGESNYSYYI